jgi:thioredoxin reductase (NADPH)
MARPLKNLAEIAVIGGGLAGLSAARQATRLGRLVTLFEGSGMYGGQVATVEAVDGLGVPGQFSGQDVAIHLLEEARKTGVHVVEAPVTAITMGEKLAITDEEGRSYAPEAIILATGASARKLGVAGEEEFAGRGLSHCATCDGGFFRGEDVVVVGGGDSALQEALVLTGICRQVHMICRSPPRAKRSYIDRLAAKRNVSFVWDSEVTDILGGTGVTGVRFRNVRDGTTGEIPCSGVFPFIGVAPNTDFLSKRLLSVSGHVDTGPDLATSDPRILAAGAARSGYGGQIVEAAAEGVVAAAAAARLLRPHSHATHSGKAASAAQTITQANQEM